MPRPKRFNSRVSRLRSAITLACATLLGVGAVALMLGHGGSWVSVIAGCALFALGVRLAESGLGPLLYGRPLEERPSHGSGIS